MSSGTLVISTLNGNEPGFYDGTSDSRKDWSNVGDYKRLPNEVGGRETCIV